MPLNGYAASGGTAILIPHMSELIVGSIAFALVCFVLMKFVFPKMEQTFQARVEAIEGGIKKAEAAQAEANELLAQYKQQLHDAQTKASEIRDEARAEAKKIKDELLAKAAEERDRIIDAGQRSLAAERQKLIRELRSEVGTIAVDLAGKIVGESLADEARKRGTVDRFLAELGNGSGGSQPAKAGSAT